MAMSADRRECAAVHKIRVNARTEIRTVRGKHEFIGDGRMKLNINKLKSLRACSQMCVRWLVPVRFMDLVPLCSAGKLASNRWFS